jgi:hypothetical protein
MSAKGLLFLMVAAAATTVWFWAFHQFPETTPQLRLVLLLLATGGPDE